jgi:hypothetical protein
MWADDMALISWDYAYKIDLTTGLWSRFSTNARSSLGANGTRSFGEGWAVHDPLTGRVYACGGSIAGQTALPYVDLATGAWSSIPRTGSDLNGLDQRTVFIDQPRNQMVMKAIVEPYFQGTPAMPPGLYAIDLTTGAGPTALPLSGSLPTHDNRWDLNPADGCWYTYAGDGSNQIDKLTPPASAGAPWTCSKVTVTGASLPPRSNDSTAGNAHYTRFFYVPKLACFAWVAGVETKVALIKP